MTACLSRVWGRGQQEQPLHALVTDECLLESAVPFHDLDEVIHDAVLEAEDHVEVSKADVGVHHHTGLAGERQPSGDVGGGGGLADAALAGRDDDAL